MIQTNRCFLVSFRGGMLTRFKKSMMNLCYKIRILKEKPPLVITSVNYIDTKTRGSFDDQRKTLH
jgi:hypothetical protein